MKENEIKKRKKKTDKEFRKFVKIDCLFVRHSALEVVPVFYLARTPLNLLLFLSITISRTDGMWLRLRLYPAVNVFSWQGLSLVQNS